MDEQTLKDLHNWVDAVAARAALDAIWDHVASDALESFDQLQEDRAVAHLEEGQMRAEFLAHFPQPAATT